MAKSKKSETCWKEYKRLKNKVTLESRKSKKKYYSEQLGQCKDINPSWKVLKSVIPNKNSPSNLTHDSDEIAKLTSEFNAHFANVAGNLRKRNGIDNVPNNSESIKSSVKHQGFIFSPVTEDEVLKSIDSLKNTKSVGIDDINYFI